MIFGIAASAIMVVIIARRFWRPDPTGAQPLVDQPTVREALLGLAPVAVGVLCLAESVRESSGVELFFL
jgi:hypothetical protein